MKKIKFSDKLSIEQTQVALLDSNQMSKLNGGNKITTKTITHTCPGTNGCSTFTCCPGPIK